MHCALAWLLIAATITAPTGSPGYRRFEYTQIEMAAAVKLILYAGDESVADRAAKAAFARIRDLNAVLSDYDPASELSQLCRAASDGAEVRVSVDLWRVLSRAKEISEASKGAFDITVGPVVRLWRRARRTRQLPDPGRLEKAMALVGHDFIKLNPERRTVALSKPSLRLDLGGIAKGYAGDEALKTLVSHGVTSALVDIGGDVVLGDAPPGMPGWRIGVVSSEKERSSMQHVWLSRVALATSGDTEQFVTLGGKRYSHIVDPRTGIGLTSQSCVTIVAPDGMTADALASAVSVLGPREGLPLIEGTMKSVGRITQCFQGETRIHESRGWQVSFEPTEEIAPEETPESKPLDPTVTPTAVWMLEPVSLPEAKAETEKEMKPYTEKLPGTEVTFDMVPIPKGRFLMGSPESETDRGKDEGPQFEVELEPFWMGKCEVTWEEYELWGLGYDYNRHEAEKKELSDWDRLADTITRPTKPYSDMTFGMGREGHPAICMTQLAAKVYCKWLSAKTGRYYRLPTEAEWEYACRAGTKTAYSFGADPNGLGDYGWHFDNSDDKYHPVGKKKPNPWGLCDMHGNVAEWVLDRHTPEGYKQLAGQIRQNPLMPPEGIYPRVTRGGSWNDDPDKLRSAARMGSNQDWKMGDPQMPKSIWYHTEATFVGFRVVRPLEVPTPEEAARYDVDQALREALADYLEFLAGRQ